MEVVSEFHSTSDSEHEHETEHEAEAESELGLDSEMEMEAELEAEMEAHLDVEEGMDSVAEDESDAEFLLDEAEAEADAQQALADATGENDAQLDAEIEEGIDLDASTDSEFSVDIYGEPLASTDSAFVEGHDDVVINAVTRPRPYGKGLRPSAHVTIGRELLSEENFSNEDSRAVFKRNARQHEITRFEKRVNSSGGQAVVGGVSKLPCGKDLTDKGLFAPQISNNPGLHFVEAVDPNPMEWVDDNIHAIKKLPVVPQYAVKDEPDEYGDMPEH